MDRLIYIAMASARHTSAKQAVTANNIANINTDGFKKDFINMMEAEKQTKTRINAEIKNTIPNLAQGILKSTGDKHDIISQNSWMSVIGMDGEQHYLTTASLSIDRDGMLVDQKNNLMLTVDGDPIQMGRVRDFEIGSDGTVSAIPFAGEDTESIVRGRLGFFDLEVKEIQKDKSGRITITEDPQPSEFGSIKSGFIEGSNVIMAQEMLNMIENSRQYEYATKLIESAKSMHDSSAKLLR